MVDEDVEREQLEREAWSALSAVFWGDEMHDRFHDAAEGAGVPHPGALKALLGIEPSSPVSMRGMAERLRCDASYVTALVDALEERGYVERRVSDDDRRVKLVHLTLEGRRAQVTAEHVLSQPPKVVERLSLSELRTLAKLTAKLR